MENILLAGATGYLGQHILTELSLWRIPAVAVARNPEKLRKLDPELVRIVKADVTEPSTIDGICTDIDTVISTLGITRQKDGLTYMEVDYHANLNLLRESQRRGVRKFIYISVINGDKLRHLAITAAKEKFVDELKASGTGYTIIRPNGFYSDMLEFLEMAKRGRIYLFGKGEFKMNPIHGADLAEICVQAISQSMKEITIGGPDILTHNEIADMAFRALAKPSNIAYLPSWIRKGFLSAMRTFTSSRTFGSYEFFLEMMGQDNIAPRYGIHRLQDYFNHEIEKQNNVNY